MYQGYTRTECPVSRMMIIPVLGTCGLFKERKKLMRW